MSDRNYHEEVKINKFALDDEWIEHPDKQMYWGEQAAYAETEKNLADMRRKIKKAELYKKYRLDYETRGIKFTDKMLEADVVSDPEYLQTTIDLINATERSNIMDTAKWGFIDRKISLERLQGGMEKGLFATPEQRNAEREVDREAMRRRMRNR